MRDDNSYLTSLAIFFGLAIILGSLTPFPYGAIFVGLYLLALVRTGWRKRLTWQQSLAFPKAIFDALYPLALLLLIWGFFGILGSVWGTTPGQVRGGSLGIGALCLVGAGLCFWIRFKLEDRFERKDRERGE